MLIDVTIFLSTGLTLNVEKNIYPMDRRTRLGFRGSICIPYFEEPVGAMNCVSQPHDTVGINGDMFHMFDQLS